jgi:hypothetical protein
LKYRYRPQILAINCFATNILYTVEGVAVNRPKWHYLSQTDAF